MPSLVASISSLDHSFSRFSEDASDTMSICSFSLDAASSKYENLLVAPNVGHKTLLVTSSAVIVGLSVVEALLAHGDDGDCRRVERLQQRDNEVVQPESSAGALSRGRPTHHLPR